MVDAEVERTLVVAALVDRDVLTVEALDVFARDALRDIDCDCDCDCDDDAEDEPATCCACCFLSSSAAR